jgi:hypothetical protein
VSIVIRLGNPSGIKKWLSECEGNINAKDKIALFHNFFISHIPRMSIQQYGRKFPVLLKTPSPKGHVELLETVGKGNYGYVYKVYLENVPF